MFITWIQPHQIQNTSPQEFAAKIHLSPTCQQNNGRWWGPPFVKYNFTLPKTHLYNNVQLKSTTCQLRKGRWRGPLIFWIQPSQTKHISTTMCTRNRPQATRNLGSDRCSFLQNSTSPHPKHISTNMPTNSKIHQRASSDQNHQNPRTTTTPLSKPKPKPRVTEKKNQKNKEKR